MAHRDGAAGTAGTAGTPGPTGIPDEPVVPPADLSDLTDLSDLSDLAPPATGAEPVQRRRPGRPSSGRTPAFGISLGAIRQRAGSPPRETADLRRSLADTEAQTNELRVALDELRQALDDTTPPERPPARPLSGRRRRRRRRPPLLLLVGAGAAVVILVAGAIAVTNDPDGDPATVRAGRPAASPSGPTAAGSASAPSTAGSPTASSATSLPPSASPTPGVSTTPMPWRDGPVTVPPNIPVTGPGIDMPGTDVTVAIDPDLKHLDVYERAYFATPQDTVTLTLPDSSVWGSGLPDAEPVVDSLQVELDTVPVTPRADPAGWFAIPRTGRVTTVTLRYRVSGTFVNYSGKASVRRLIGVPSFTGRGSLAQAAPVLVRIDDPRVLGLSCLSATTGTTICGQQKGTTWTAALPQAANPVAIVQADLRPLR